MVYLITLNTEVCFLKLHEISKGGAFDFTLLLLFELCCEGMNLDRYGVVALYMSHLT